jgi:glutamate-1-semialdehyde 2,1-aminomutase
LYARARRVIPGAVHLSGRPLVAPGDTPLYFERGKGCLIWDADGREYVDFVMAYGPPLLGYANERVDGAASAQAARGNLLSLNHPLQVQLAERLVARVPHADMAILLKTGSEATTAALRVARRCTGRRLVARCGYHGWHDWCLPLETYVPAGLGEQILEYDVNDPESLERIFAEHPGQIAAVILAPEMAKRPERALFEGLIERTHQNGALFVLDEVKTGLRTKPGTLQQHFDFAPDVTTLSKALGNGWPIAALVGRRAVMEHGAGLHVSATYHGESAALAAALTTLEILDEEDVCGHVWHLGQRLITELNEAAARWRIPAVAYGEPFPPMPFLSFKGRDHAESAVLRDAFFADVVDQGILMHPRHLWFISYAHQEHHIDRAIEAADAAFGRLAAAHGELL